MQVVSVGQRPGKRVCCQDSLSSSITIPGKVPPAFWLEQPQNVTAHDYTLHRPPSEFLYLFTENILKIFLS